MICAVRVATSHLRFMFGIDYFLGLAMLCSLPISLIKNFINVVQLWEASKQLAELDISETASRKPSSSSKD